MGERKSANTDAQTIGKRIDHFLIVFKSETMKATDAVSKRDWNGLDSIVSKVSNSETVTAISRTVGTTKSDITNFTNIVAAKTVYWQIAYLD